MASIKRNSAGMRSQPQAIARIRAKWLARGLKVAIVPSLGWRNLVKPTGILATAGNAPGTTVTLAGRATGGGKAQLDQVLEATNGLTVISVWLPAEGANYLFADGVQQMASNQQAAANTGWSWSRSDATSGTVEQGNLARQRFTLHGVADYDEANYAIWSTRPTPVATRFNRSSSLLSFFAFGEKTSPDVTTSASYTASDGGVYVGGFHGGSSVDRHAVILVFEGALTDSEIKELTHSIYAPFSVFEEYLTASERAHAAFAVLHDPQVYSRPGKRPGRVKTQMPRQFGQSVNDRDPLSHGLIQATYGNPSNYFYESISRRWYGDPYGGASFSLGRWADEGWGKIGRNSQNYRNEVNLTQQKHTGRATHIVFVRPLKMPKDFGSNIKTRRFSFLTAPSLWGFAEMHIGDPANGDNKFAAKGAGNSFPWIVADEPYEIGEFYALAYTTDLQVGKQQLFINGIKQSTITNSTYGGDKTITSHGFYSTTNGEAYEIYGAYSWNRILSDREVDEVSRDPWRLFARDSVTERSSFAYALDSAGALFDAAVTASATSSAELTTEIQLSATASSSASTSASLTTEIQLSASASSAATTSAELTTDSTLNASVTSSASATASLTTEIALSGTISTNATATGSLSVEALLDASVTSSASASGTLTTEIQLSASATSSATTSASLTNEIRLSATASSSATASAALTTEIQLSAAVTSSATTEAQLSAGSQLDGAATSSSTASGTLTTEIQLSGSATGQATTTAGLETAITFSASATTTATHSAVLATEIQLGGSASSSATAAAALFTEKLLDAAISSNAAASAALTTSITLAAAAASSATASSELTGGVVVIPTNRVLTIGGESRTITVSAETRTLSVTAEARTTT